MKLSSTIGGILVLALVAWAGVSLYQQLTGMRADLQALKVQDEKSQAVIQAKDQEIAALLVANVALREKDAAGQVERAALRRERDTARTNLAAALEDLKTAPPEALVTKARGLLGTDEIFLRRNAASELEAVYSIPAFRLDVGVQEEWHVLKFTLVPNLERELEVASGQLTAVRSERDNLTVVVADKDIIIGEKDNQIAARDQVIHSIKKLNLFREVRDFGLGFVVATVLELVLGK